MVGFGRAGMVRCGDKRCGVSDMVRFGRIGAEWIGMVYCVWLRWGKAGEVRSIWFRRVGVRSGKVRQEWY